MTGHQAHNQSHGANPLRTETPDLNQQAALIAQARAEGNPYADHLAAIEPKFIAELTRQLPDTDHSVIGAVLLTAGQLTASVLAMLSPESRPHAGPIACNLLQLAGQQLYHGRAGHIAACPYPLATGKPCSHVGKAESEQQLDAVMRGHIGLHHPGQTWPIEEAPASDHSERFEPYDLTDAQATLDRMNTPPIRPLTDPIERPEPGFQPGPHQIHLIGQDPFDRLEITYAAGAEVDPTWGQQIAKAAMAIVAGPEPSDG